MGTEEAAHGIPEGIVRDLQPVHPSPRDAAAHGRASHEGRDEVRIAQPRDLLERDVTTQVCDYLRAKGWELIRLHAGTVRKGSHYIRLGSKGRPDWVAIHPDRPAFYVEMKRNKGGMLSEEQLAYIGRLMRYGYQVAVPQSVDEFAAWFKREIEARNG
jgi:predicted RNA binding protein YcfA (HicA-like mRNA interferase family)